MPTTAGLPTFSETYPDSPTRQTPGGLRYIDATDTYVRRLEFANAGMLNRGNLACFDYVMRNLCSTHAMLEIGVFCGLSTNLIHYFRKRHGRSNTLFNCDRWEFEGAAGNVGASQLAHADCRAFVRDTYRRNVEFFSRDHLPHTIELLSDEFFSSWENEVSVTDLFGRRVQLGGPLAFCYVDGNHTYKFARRDFLNVDRYLEPGGFILFDDSADGSPWGVTTVIEEIKQRTDYRIVAANPNYLVQKL